MYLPPEIKEEFDREASQEFKQKNMIDEYQYLVLDKEEVQAIKAETEAQRRLYNQAEFSG